MAPAQGTDGGGAVTAGPTATPLGRVLVVGALGQLGRECMRTFADLTPVGADRAEVDVTDAAAVAAYIRAIAPDVVINAAAYTAVDAAESDEAAAAALNAAAPAHIARACAQLGRERGRAVRLVHLSTDYVFDGTATTPYPEDAPRRPASAYGRTKADGEVAVLRELPTSGFVVRTAWLYGEFGQNFVRTMLQLERSRPTISVVDDQRGQPTSARDLSARIRLLLESDVPAGIYHGTNAGATTWHGFTREIYRLIGADPQRVLPTDTASFPRPAPRPAYSVLGHDRWAQVGLAPMRPWDAALAEHLPSLVAALDRG